MKEDTVTVFPTKWEPSSLSRRVARKRKYAYEQQNMADAKRGDIFKWRLRENYATFCHDVSEWFVRWVYVAGYVVIGG